MKCQQCEKPAVFHITELTGTEPQELHLCEDHVRDYLAAPAEAEGTAGGPPKDKLTSTAEELAKIDLRTCPNCGITFHEFRHQGRLGCPFDYKFFEQELEPLLLNIHGEFQHTGKRPRSGSLSAGRNSDLIRLRREMQEAVEREDYEAASRIRDEIRQIESSGQGSGAANPPEATGGDAATDETT